MKRRVLRFCNWLVQVTVSVCLFAGASAQSVEGDAHAAFTEAYAAYTTAVEQGDLESALASAKRAWESGSAYFGRVSENTGALAMNYGNMLGLSGTDNASAAEKFSEADAIFEELYGPNSVQRLEALLALASVQETFEEKLASMSAALSMHRAVLPEDDVAYARLQSHGGELLTSTGRGSPEATGMLIEALDTLEQEFGEDSPELLSTLLALGSATADGGAVSRRQIRFFDRAVAIARAAQSDEAIADLELQIALRLGRQSRGYRDAMPYISSAIGAYDVLFGPDHPKTALAALTLGQALIATGESDEGVIAVEKAIGFYDGKPAYISNLIRARQLIMAVYSTQGNDDLYTVQLMEVGRLSEDLPTPVDYLPIVKVAPVYPAEAAARGVEGYVVVQYTVDEEGRTRDPIVVESGSKQRRPEVFHDAAVASTRGYRYIPRFENGVPVSVPGVTTRIEFVLAN